MDKLKNKRSILIISIVIIALIAVIVIAIGSIGEKDIKESKEDMVAAIEETEVSADATEEEKEAVEELQAEYEEKISNAKDSKEAEKLKAEFEKKAQEATGNKVSVPSKPAGESKPSGSTGGSSSGSGDTPTKPSTGSEEKPSGGSGNTGSTDKPSGGSSTGGNTKPSHTHIAQGDMGWADSPEEIRSIYNNAYSAWRAKVERGDTTSPEPINYSYKKCGCGKYTGTFVYGSPHSHIAVGNTGKWFNSQAEAEACYIAEVKKWDKLWEDGNISDEEYGEKCPFRYEIRQCSCKKYTLSWYAGE